MVIKYAVVNGDKTLDVLPTREDAWHYVTAIASDLASNGSSIVGYGFVSTSTRMGLIELHADDERIALGVVPVEMDE